MIGPDMVDWCVGHIAGLEVAACGAAAQVVQEDRPEAIAHALAAWLDRHGLRAGDTVRSGSAAQPG